MARTPAGTPRFHRESDRTLLARDGLDNLDTLFDRFMPEKTRHAGRHVTATRLADGTQVFVKLQHGRQRLLPTMRELRDGRFFRSIPENEWNGLCLLRSAGLDAAEPMAVFRSGRLHFRSAIIIRAVPAPESIHEMIRGGAWDELGTDDRKHLRLGMAETVRTIHRAGLGWAGIAAKHLYPAAGNDGSWKLWLIDCEGVHGSATRATYLRDLAKLRESLKRSGADTATLGMLEDPLPD
ncbi:MAG: hypothetical protein IAE97_08620 [Chthoniobacterales bacterium]|nr:hypothetical protein [Chthoniobacterales bacterium]